MIFAREPEYRHMLAPRDPRGILRLANGRRGLQQSQQRTAEQTHLLPCNHGRRSVPQPLDIGPGGITGLEQIGLGQKHISQCATVISW